MHIFHCQGKIYVFGGWDGTRDIDDLWVYNIYDNKWNLLSINADRDVGSPIDFTKIFSMFLTTERFS